MEKVFLIEKKELFLENEILKRNGFEFESSKTLGKEEKGFYFIFKAKEEFFKENEVFKEAKEITGKEKEEILEKFKDLEGDVISGMGNIF